jgi:hypothetical protein
MHLNPESLSFALLTSNLGSIARAANILGMRQATLSRKLTALDRRCPICSPQYPNLRRTRSRPVPMGQCAVSRWCEGCRNKGKARLSSAPDRISERITLAFQTLFRSEAKNWNLPYISIGYGGEGGSQPSLKDQAFSTFLDQNPPFELRPKAGASMQRSTRDCTGADLVRTNSYQVVDNVRSGRLANPHRGPCTLSTTSRAGCR